MTKEVEKIVAKARKYYVDKIVGDSSLSNTGKSIITNAYGAFRKVRDYEPKTVKGARTLYKQVKAAAKKVNADKKKALKRAVNYSEKHGDISESQAEKLRYNLKYVQGEQAETAVEFSGNYTNPEDYYEENKGALQDAKLTFKEYDQYKLNGEKIPASLQHKVDALQEAYSDVDWISSFGEADAELLG